jgi:hypothetical protein
MNPDKRLLSYSYGNAYGPNGIFGRSQLKITTSDGQTTVALEHQQGDREQSWTAILLPKTEQAIWDALQKSDFPNTKRPEAFVPDSTVGVITVENIALYPEPISISLPLDMLKKLPDYAELLSTLHSIIFQISGGSTGENSLPDTVVSQIKSL